MKGFGIEEGGQTRRQVQVRDCQRSNRARRVLFIIERKMHKKEEKFEKYYKMGEILGE